MSLYLNTRSLRTLLTWALIYQMVFSSIAPALANDTREKSTQNLPLAESSQSFSHPQENEISKAMREAGANPFIDTLKRASDSDIPEVKMNFNKNDPSLDQDPFFLKSQSWINVNENLQADEYPMVATFDDGFAIQVPNSKVALKVNAPLHPIAVTEDYTVLAANEDSEILADGFFLVSHETLSFNKGKVAVPVFFFPLPGDGWNKGLRAYEIPEKQLLVIEDSNEDFLPIHLVDIDTVVKVETANYAMALGAAYRSLDLKVKNLRSQMEKSGEAQKLDKELLDLISEGISQQNDISRLEAITQKLNTLSEKIISKLNIPKIITPPRGSTAGFGMLFTGIDLDHPEASIDWSAQISNKETSKNLLNALHHTFSEFFISSAHADDTSAAGISNEDQKEIAAGDAKLQARLIRVAAVLGIALLASVVVKYGSARYREHFKIKREVEDQILAELGKSPKGVGKVFHRLKQESVEIGDVFAHTLTTIAQSSQVWAANALEFMGDRFMPTLFSSKNRLLGKLFDNTFGYERGSNNRTPVNFRSWFMGAIVMGWTDSACVALQIYWVIPWMGKVMASWSPLLGGVAAKLPLVGAALSGFFTNTVPDRAYHAFVETNPVVLHMNKNEVIRNVTGYTTKGALNFATDLVAQLQDLIKAEVREEMIKKDKLDPDDPKNASIFEERYQAGLEARLKKRGLPGKEEFLFDAGTLYEWIVSKFGIAIPEPEKMSDAQFDLMTENEFKIDSNKQLTPLNALTPFYDRLIKKADDELKIDPNNPAIIEIVKEHKRRAELIKTEIMDLNSEFQSNISDYQNMPRSEFVLKTFYKLSDRMKHHAAKHPTDVNLTKASDIVQKQLIRFDDQFQKEKKRFAGMKRSGILLPSLRLAISRLEKLLVQKPNDKDLNAALSLLRETLADISLLEGFVLNPVRTLLSGSDPFDGLKDRFLNYIAIYRSAKQSLILLTYEGNIDLDIQNLPGPWVTKFGNSGAKIAGDLFRRSMTYYLTGNKRSLGATSEDLEKLSKENDVQKAATLAFLNYLKNENIISKDQDISTLTNEQIENAKKTHWYAYEFYLDRKTVDRAQKDEAIAKAKLYDENKYEKESTHWFERLSKSVAGAMPLVGGKLRGLVSVKKNQEREAASQADKIFMIKNAGRPFNIETASEEDKNNWKHDFRDALVRIVGLRTDFSVQEGLQEKIEKEASEKTDGELKANVGLSEYLHKLSLTDKRKAHEIVSAIYSENYIKSYVNDVKQSEKISPLSSAQPGRFQKYRQKEHVKNSTFRTRVARFFESFVSDTAYERGLVPKLNRNIPFFQDFTGSMVWLAKVTPSRATALYAFQVLVWNMNLTAPQWIWFQSFMWTIMTPYRWLMRLFDMQGLKPMGDFKKMFLFSLIYTWLTFEGELPKQIMTSDFMSLWNATSIPSLVIETMKVVGLGALAMGAVPAVTTAAAFVTNAVSNTVIKAGSLVKNSFKSVFVGGTSKTFSSAEETCNELLRKRKGLIRRIRDNVLSPLKWNEPKKRETDSESIKRETETGMVYLSNVIYA